jgi:hypothetical protein
MPSDWEKIKKTVKGELSDAAAMTKKYFKIGKINQLKQSIKDDELKIEGIKK